jgi:site-specific recombinase XerD
MTSLLLMHLYIRFSEMTTIPLTSVKIDKGRHSLSFTTIRKTNQTRRSFIDATAIPGVAERDQLISCVEEFIRRLRSGLKVLTLATPLFTSPSTGLPLLVEEIRHLAQSLMAKAGINTTKFTAYSLKAASLSSLADKGYDHAALSSLAGLSQKSATLNRFYIKPLVQQSSGESLASFSLPKLSSSFVAKAIPPSVGNGFSRSPMRGEGRGNKTG